MELILKDTSIFDETIDEKLGRAIKSSKNKFSIESVYRFTVSFHVSLLNDPRFVEFNVLEPNKSSKGTRKDKIYDVLGFQLKKLEKVLEKYEIEVYSTTIQGEQLEGLNTVKIIFTIDYLKEQLTLGKVKNNKRPKISTVIPSLPYTTQNVTNLASDRINHLFNKLMNVIKDNKMMSDILEIDETNDEKKLFKAFAYQYGELWLTNSEREKELLNQLGERCETVIKKFISEK